MKNEQMYKTAKERYNAFMKFCVGKACKDCILNKNKCCTNKNKGCTFNWLDLEVEQKLEPCPFCHGETYVKTHSEGHEVRCKARHCYVGKTFENKDVAIAEHNRVAKAVMAAKKGNVR